MAKRINRKGIKQVRISREDLDRLMFERQFLGMVQEQEERTRPSYAHVDRLEDAFLREEDLISELAELGVNVNDD